MPSRAGPALAGSTRGRPGALASCTHNGDIVYMKRGRRSPPRSSARPAARPGRPRGPAFARGSSADIRSKHLKIDQRKLDRAKRHLGVKTEQEAIDLALAAVADEDEIVEALRAARGKVRFGSTDDV
jgi:hypothetical protein